MLGDAASFARRHGRGSKRVQQGGLAVVDVAHDRDHRAARGMVRGGFGVGGDAGDVDVAAQLGGAPARGHPPREAPRRSRGSRRGPRRSSRRGRVGRRAGARTQRWWFPRRRRPRAGRAGVWVSVGGVGGSRSRIATAIRVRTLTGTDPAAGSVVATRLGDVGGTLGAGFGSRAGRRSARRSGRGFRGGARARVRDVVVVLLHKSGEALGRALRRAGLALEGLLAPARRGVVASAAAALAPSASVPVAFARKDGGARRDEAARRRRVKREGRKPSARGRPNVTSAAANAREAKLGSDDDDAVASAASARRSAAIVARRIVRCSRRARVASAERP